MDLTFCWRTPEKPPDPSSTIQQGAWGNSGIGTQAEMQQGAQMLFPPVHSAPPQRDWVRRGVSLAYPSSSLGPGAAANQSRPGSSMGAAPQIQPTGQTHAGPGGPGYPYHGQPARGATATYPAPSPSHSQGLSRVPAAFVPAVPQQPPDQAQWWAQGQAQPSYPPQAPPAGHGSQGFCPHGPAQQQGQGQQPQQQWQRQQQQQPARVGGQPGGGGGWFDPGPPAANPVEASPLGASGSMGGGSRPWPAAPAPGQNPGAPAMAFDPPAGQPPLQPGWQQGKAAAGSSTMPPPPRRAPPGGAERGPAPGHTHTFNSVTDDPAPGPRSTPPYHPAPSDLSNVSNAAATPGNLDRPSAPDPTAVSAKRKAPRPPRDSRDPALSRLNLTAQVEARALERCRNLGLCSDSDSEGEVGGCGGEGSLGPAQTGPSGPAAAAASRARQSWAAAAPDPLAEAGAEGVGAWASQRAEPEPGAPEPFGFGAQAQAKGPGSKRGSGPASAAAGAVKGGPRKGGGGKAAPGSDLVDSISVLFETPEDSAQVAQLGIQEVADDAGLSLALQALSSCEGAAATWIVSDDPFGAAWHTTGTAQTANSAAVTRRLRHLAGKAEATAAQEVGQGRLAASGPSAPHAAAASSGPGTAAVALFASYWSQVASKGSGLLLMTLGPRIPGASAGPSIVEAIDSGEEGGRPLLSVVQASYWLLWLPEPAPDPRAAAGEPWPRRAARRVLSSLLQSSAPVCSVGAQAFLTRALNLGVVPPEADFTRLPLLDPTLACWILEPNLCRKDEAASGGTGGGAAKGAGPGPKKGAAAAAASESAGAAAASAAAASTPGYALSDLLIRHGLRDLPAAGPILRACHVTVNHAGEALPLENPGPGPPIMANGGVVQRAMAELACGWSLSDRARCLLARAGLPQAAFARETRVAALLSLMEYRGLGFDPSVPRRFREGMAAALADVEAKADALLGYKCNLASYAQVSKALYTDLGLPPPPQLPGAPHRPSATLPTDEASLKRLHAATGNQLPLLVLEHRTLTSSRTRFLDTDWAAGVGDGEEGQAVDAGAAAAAARPGLAVGGASFRRIHGHWNQLATATGRLSSSGPNLQAITRYEVPLGPGLLINAREAFVAPPGRGALLLSADYSQIELRVLAHFSGDPGLRALFVRGPRGEEPPADAFAAIAARMAMGGGGVGADREKAKRTTYGIIYGVGAPTLASHLGIDQQEARRLIDRFLAAFPGVRQFIEAAKRAALQHGRVVTLAGRTRPIPDIRAQDPGRRAEGERKAVNSVIQGSASDIIKVAMVAWLSVEQRTAGAGGPGGPTFPPVACLGQIHDELLFEVDTRRCAIEAAAAAVRKVMVDAAGALGCTIPLQVKVRAGHNWGQCTMEL